MPVHWTGLIAVFGNKDLVVHEFPSTRITPLMERDRLCPCAQECYTGWLS